MKSISLTYFDNLNGNRIPKVIFFTCNSYSIEIKKFSNSYEFHVFIDYKFCLRFDAGFSDYDIELDFD